MALAARTRTTTRLLVRSVALAIVVVVTTVACVPPTGGPGPASASEPPAGCHDHGAPGVGDVAYSGEPSEYGNLRHFTSTDGSCTGAVVPRSVPATTLIVADSAANAEFLCRTLVAAPSAGAFDAAGPWSPTFGVLAYRCAG